MHEIHRRILAINRTASEHFLADESARARHLVRHPTQLAVVECMDGRLQFATLTKTPLGVVRSFRAIGGRLEAWWPSFLGRFRSFVAHATREGQRAVVLLTYHRSASSLHLGCAGWGYDTAAARAHAERLAERLAYVFGEALVPIVAGVETDRDVLTLHLPSGDVSGDSAGEDDASVARALASAAPSLDAAIVRDLVPVMRGNALRVAELRATPKQLEAKDHQERVLAIGQDFEWLNRENFALIINDADLALARSIEVAASILRKNLEHAAADETFALLTAIPYQMPGIDHRQAVVRAEGLLAFALEVVGRVEPSLVASGRLHAMAGVLFAPALRLEPLARAGDLEP